MEQPDGCSRYVTTVNAAGSTPAGQVGRHWRVRRSGSPLLVAAAAACVGGLGNVAFSLHDGSQLGLASVRFVAGALLCALWLAIGRIPRVPGGWSGVIAALSGGASPLLLILAAGHTSTAVFTLISTLAPALVVVGGRAIGARRASVHQGLLAAAAVGCSCVAVLLSSTTGRPPDTVGVLLAIAATVALAVALLAASTLQRVHPAQTLQNLCMAGAGLGMVLAFAGVEVNITPKSVAVAVFIAAVPGGVAKAALLWAASRTAPHLVAATVSFAVVPAAVGAALWLGQPVTAAAAVFGLVATAAVALLVAQPAPAARGELPDPLRT